MRTLAMLKGQVIGFPQKGGGRDMATIRCPKCGGTKVLQITAREPEPRMEIRGIITCNHWQRDQNKFIPHEWPIKVLARDEAILIDVREQLPVAESVKLTDKVPVGLADDIREAERAHFSQCYKAAVVMCRRALQLALEELLDKTDVTLGPLLAEERKKRLLCDLNYQLARRVKDYGDVGAHKTVSLDSQTVETLIHDSVEILNELYKASQSGTGSNAP